VKEIKGLNESEKVVLEAVKPYLPALGRAAQHVFEGFIKHFLNKNWPRIDMLMYVHMTQEERDKLENEVLSGARNAVIGKLDTIALTKELAFKFLMRIILAALV
jgi:hypothetical protein